MPTKAIGYLRVSSANQAKDGKDGFPRQRAAIRAYCTSKRVELIEEHEDAGVSGTVPLEGREGLSTALQRCGETGATVLVVEKADRLGRDLIVSEMAVRAFSEAGVSIVTADTGQSLTDADNDPSRKLIRQVLNALAEYERSALVAKLRVARERKKRVLKVLGLVGLEARAKHFPRQLSGGEEQRVAIARAIVADPTLLVADEPTGDLDAKNAAEILTLLQRLHAELRKTILMVTHDPHAAERAQKTLHLDKGVLQP